MGDSARGDLKPRMAAGEIDTLRALLSGARTYLEFGSGGSTLMAVRSPVARIWSVEGDPVWLEKLRENNEIRQAELNGRLSLLFSDLGEVGRYSKPVDQSTSYRWPRYYTEPFDAPEARGADLFLVDGRFRVACVLSILLSCRRHCRIAVHDLWDRPQYHPVLPFLMHEASVETLGVFRPSPLNLFKRGEMRQLLATYRYNPA